MIIVLAQINPRVGDLEGNYRKAAEVMGHFTKDNEDRLVIFPELSVTGYPPKDLLEKPAFIDAVAKYTERWSALSTLHQGMLFGTVIRNTSEGQKPLFNSAVLAVTHVAEASQPKSLLPTYDVFDEARYFEPAKDSIPMMFHGLRLGVSICEDIWNDKEYWKERVYHRNPIQDLVGYGCDILINLSASPYAIGKPKVRAEMLNHVSKKYKKSLVYVNQVGGNDDVVYDGHSLAFDGQGNMSIEMASFEEGWVGVPLEQMGGVAGLLVSDKLRPKEPEEQEIFEALVMGTRDYAKKTGFSKAVLGLSGGIDSALVAAIAAEALGKENVLGIGMPSKYSSDGSVSDAKKIAEALGIQFKILPIGMVHRVYMDALAPAIEWEDGKVELWEENLQARIRGAMLMSVSNKENRLLLTTGNKSEVAAGYCTLYGDTCGGLAVISDVFKTKVYNVCRWINKTRGKEIIPEGSISKPPSAELRPNQTDQQSLPPYDFLDCILGLYIEERMEVDEIMSFLSEHDSQIPAMPTRESVERIVKMTDRAEYKRKQLAPGLKITKKAFGTGRQMPIAQGWR